MSRESEIEDAGALIKPQQSLNRAVIEPLSPEKYLKSLQALVSLNAARESEIEDEGRLHALQVSACSRTYETHALKEAERRALIELSCYISLNRQ